MTIIIVDTYENQQLVMDAEIAAGWYPLPSYISSNDIASAYVVRTFKTEAERTEFVVKTLKGMGA